MSTVDLAAVVAETLGLDDGFLLEGEEPTQETLDVLLMSPPTLEEAERLLQDTPPPGAVTTEQSPDVAPVKRSPSPSLTKTQADVLKLKLKTLGKPQGKGKGKKFQDAPKGLRTIIESQAPSPTATTAPASPLTPCLDLDTSYFDEDLVKIPIETIDINSPEKSPPRDPRARPPKVKGNQKFPLKLKGFRPMNPRFNRSDPYPEVRLCRPRFNYLYDSMAPDEPGQNQVETVIILYKFAGDPFPEHREAVSYKLPKMTNKANVIARITPRAQILQTEVMAQYVRRVRSQDYFLSFLQETNKVLDLNSLIFEFKYPVPCLRTTEASSLTQAEAMAHPKGVPTCLRNRDPEGKPTMFVEVTVTGPKLRAPTLFGQMVANNRSVRNIVDKVVNHRQLVSAYLAGISNWVAA